MAVLTSSRLNIQILWLERLIGIFFRDVLISWRRFIRVFVLRLFFLLLTRLLVCHLWSSRTCKVKTIHF